MSLLLSFESAARQRSFTRAAEELSLTPSAVSRQVQVLEEMLGVALFQRNGRHIEPTEAGKLYLKEMTAALSRIRNATLQVSAQPFGGGVINLAILPTFASTWLMPRLHAFYEQHPGILVHVHSRIGEIDLDAIGMDAVINAGDGQWAGLVSHWLVGEELVVVASPALLARRPIASAEDLYDHLLLQIGSRADNWSRWFAARQLAPERVRLGPRFELTSHLIQAAATGIGVGLVAKCLCQSELNSGALVMALDTVFPSDLSYYFSYPPHKLAIPALNVFRDWLLQTSAEANSAARV
ncbi:LysR substrate-binding domain-containing protein [Burkholderia sp. GS2Y]|uniref:LysR substrate-binding domain-containing protein n=1 Tax=Burkholderia theae TaxID=3143496 RepID=A0ABU9WS09_9BURK